MKVKMIACVLAALFVFPGASIWEGSAAAAASGDLPERGLYAATNSFPRNTVIELTNLENNKSIRVIVAEGLDSPGLLALVSKEAAEMIGMNSGSISRIRMTQPSDPIAYKRFTDGMEAEQPDYDSGAVFIEFTEDPYQPVDPSAVVLADPVHHEAPHPAAPIPGSNAPAATNSSVPPIFLEEEWGGSRTIVDLSDNYARENVPRPAEPVIDLPPESAAAAVVPVVPIVEYADEPAREPAPEQIAEYTPEPAVEHVPESVIEHTPETAAVFVPEEHIADYTPEHIIDRTTEHVVEYTPALIIDRTTEHVIDRTPDHVVERTTEHIVEYAPEHITEAPQAQAVNPELLEYTIVSAEERPPEPLNIYNIDPDYIISGIDAPAASEAGAVEIPDEMLIPPPAALAPSPAPAAIPAPVPSSPFTVPMIAELERGSYYVQVAALAEPELLQSAINRIDSSYRPVVYNEGDRWYRILLGPLNQGESGAVLQRFKSIGYKDAFVRQGR